MLTQGAGMEDEERCLCAEAHAATPTRDQERILQLERQLKAERAETLRLRARLFAMGVDE